MERESSIKLKIYLTFLTIILLSNLSNAQDLSMDKLLKDYYILDTIKIENPIQVIYSKSDSKIALVMPKKYIENFSIKNDSVFLLANNLLVPIIKDCNLENTSNSKYLIQEYKCPPKFFIVVLLKQEYYINTMSSLGEKLKNIFDKDNKFIVSVIPYCDCEN